MPAYKRFPRLPTSRAQTPKNQRGNSALDDFVSSHLVPKKHMQVFPIKPKSIRKFALFDEVLKPLAAINDN